MKLTPASPSILQKRAKTKIEKQPDFKLLKNLYKEKVLPLSENDPYPTFRNIKWTLLINTGRNRVRVLMYKYSV